MMPYPLKHLWRATVYSWQGLKAAYCYQWVFPVEVFTFIIAAPLGIFLGNTPVEKILLIGSVWLVLIVELLNSAIETAIDRIGPERHELSGRAKDLASAAVFLTVINAFIIWLIILMPKIF
jgi:diacylglycerol kinase (ATP)